MTIAAFSEARPMVLIGERQLTKHPARACTVMRNDPMHIIVTIKDVKTDTIERVHDINYSRHASREWVSRMQFWALNNGKSVEFVNKKDIA